MMHRPRVPSPARGAGVVAAPRMLQFLLLLSSLCAWGEATVYTHNMSGIMASYRSLPALFGELWEEGKLYEGQLQFLPNNPYLCDAIDLNKTTFVGGKSPPVNSTTGLVAPTTGHNNEVPWEPIVMLAGRGRCPFHRKAMVAESLGARVQFLIIYNHEMDGEDVLVPMYSEYGQSRLRLMSVTHRTGNHLKRYIVSSSDATLEAGGPLVTMDSDPPAGIMTAQDLQEAMISTLGLFFMLVSFSGCILMCAAAVQSGPGGRVVARSPLLSVLVGDPFEEQQQPQLDANGVPIPTTRSYSLTGRHLLTPEDIDQFLTGEYDEIGTRRSTESTNSESGEASTPATETSPIKGIDTKSAANTTHLKPDESLSDSALGVASMVSATPKDPFTVVDETGTPLHCAVCLDDFNATDGPATLIRLPCGHLFHRHCIVPWLTERQAKCPLCKYDILAFVQESALNQSMVVVFDGLTFSDVARALRSWLALPSEWTAVNQQIHSDEDGVDEGPMEAGLELSQSPRAVQEESSSFASAQ